MDTDNQEVVLLYASTYVLVSLSIDRYHAIVYPMKFLQGELKVVDKRILTPTNFKAIDKIEVRCNDWKKCHLSVLFQLHFPH
ncbi:hypothetical protein P7K49_024875 [Saguinus oedipus]|uniref:Uncharacterized protein n=1 Tax=Saguinus oedipus TaxID=9490 RepID=A0ABQ9UG22_SAGOE|nr:hypothetical protein P7K49_024875 [Saguinus oedipus]